MKTFFFTTFLQISHPNAATIAPATTRPTVSWKPIVLRASSGGCSRGGTSPHASRQGPPTDYWSPAPMAPYLVTPLGVVCHHSWRRLSPRRKGRWISTKSPLGVRRGRLEESLAASLL